MIVKSEVIHTTCPYCNNSYNVNHNYVALNRDKDYGYSYIRQIACLNCLRKFVLYENNRAIDSSEIDEIPPDVLGFFEITKNDLYNFFSANSDDVKFRAEKKMYIRPMCPAKPAPKEVDDAEIIQDYNEAAMILEISPRASAALSRKCMEKLFRKKAPIFDAENLSLFELISRTIDSGALSKELITLLHYVLELTGFSVNPIKNEHPGVVADVTKEEAELNLNVLSRLFEIYYVEPAKNIAIKESLEEKMKNLGKKLL